MEPVRGLAWIAGCWRGAASGHEFELDSLLEPHSQRSRWPRTAPVELQEALDAARRAEPGWARLSREDRLRILLRAVDALEGDARLAGELAAGLGLSGEALAERLEADFLGARESLEILRGGGEVRGGTGLFAAHWSDRVGPLVSRLAARLAAGTPAVVLSDPRLPEAADALARALETADLPTGVVSVLHDDGRTVLRDALRRPGLAWLRARGTREELAGLARARGDDAFGAGLTEWSLWPLASAVHVVAGAADPVAEAECVVQRAFSPSATLFGQLPDAVGRVLCHQRWFSSFTEELLARLDGAPALAETLVPVELELPDWLDEAWALGLDEGACPIFGEAPSGAPRGRTPRAVRPVVFTNVETGGRLLRLERPAPLLSLVRVDSDEKAQNIQNTLARGSASARLEPNPQSTS